MQQFDCSCIKVDYILKIRFIVKIEEEGDGDDDDDDYEY